jgi:hypothetical protein
MKPKLLVSGCSITHGAELHNGFMHEENVKRSYSAYLARALDADLVNVALSGGSNEYIFHSVMDNLHSLNNIHSVVVMWTSHDRLHWKSNGRHWFVLPSWGSSMVDLVNFEMHDKRKHGAWFTGDNNQVIDELSNVYPFLIQNFFDSQEMAKKTQNYRHAIKAVCDAKEIKLTELNIGDLVTHKLISHIKHPSDSEHESIAKFILENYYEST